MEIRIGGGKRPNRMGKLNLIVDGRLRYATAITLLNNSLPI